MRTAVIYFSWNNRKKLQNIARGLMKGIESQGHIVDLIDGRQIRDKKLTVYRYIAIGTQSINLFGKIPSVISEALKSAGTIAGKKSFAFVNKSFFGSHKSLLGLMAVMEKEGMYIKYSEALVNPASAEEAGKHLHITE